MDNEEFQDDAEESDEPETISMEEEEKLKATASPLSKVCISVQLASTSLTWHLQLRFIMNKITSTPQRRKKFRRCAMAKYFKKNLDPDRRQSLAVVRDVHMRWNYTHAMIRRAELLQEVSLPFASSESPCQLTS